MRPSGSSVVECQSDVTGLISGVTITVLQEPRLSTTSTSCSDKTRTSDRRWRATKHSSYSGNSSKTMSLRMSKDDLVKRTLRTMDIYTGAFLALFQKLDYNIITVIFLFINVRLLWNNLYFIKWYIKKVYICCIVIINCTTPNQKKLGQYGKRK